MDTNKLIKAIKPYLKPFNLIIFFIVFCLLVILAVVVVQNLTQKKVATITPDQIKIEKGEKVVLVDANGLVEYRTSTGVFYETWDSSQIDNFFNSMRQKARDYLANPQPDLCENGYKVTLYLDGKEITVCVSEDDEELNEVFDEFPGDGDDSLSDYFDDFFGDDDADGSEEDEGFEAGLTPAPTPTPGGESGGPSDEELGLYDCSLYEQQVTGRTIISNTLCILEGDEE